MSGPPSIVTMGTEKRKKKEKLKNAMGKSWSLDAKFNLTPTPTVTVRKVTLLKANKMQLFDSCPVLGTLSEISAINLQKSWKIEFQFFLLEENSRQTNRKADGNTVFTKKKILYLAFDFVCKESRLKEQ